MYPQSMFLAKIRKISIFFSAEQFSIFKAKKSLFIAWASFCNYGKKERFSDKVVVLSCLKRRPGFWLSDQDRSLKLGLSRRGIVLSVR